MKYTIKQFKNKLKVVLIPMPARHSVSASVWIKTGGRYENPKNLGISHFLEHLVFRGTQKRTAKEIKEAIEGVGGMINAFTAEEFTCFFAKIPKRHFLKAIDVLLDITLGPLMQVSDITKEKKIITEEIRMYKDMPSYYVHDLIHQIMWPKHPLGKPITGTCKSVSGISQKMLKDFEEEFYHSSNMALVVAGSLDVNKVYQEIKERFMTLKPKTNADFEKFFCKQKTPKVSFLNKDTEQTHLSIGFHALARTHPDRYAIAVLSVILGGNMSSRLFQKVREDHGLAYQISTSLKRYQETGAFTVNAGVKNKSVLDAVNLILEELIKIKNENVKKNELQKAKDFIIGQLLIGLEDTADRMLWMGEKIITNDPMLNIESVLEKVKVVSQYDLRRVANSVLKNNNLNLAIIGPLKKRIKSVKKLINNFD